MKKALIVLGYIASIWMIAGVALKTVDTHERPDAFGIVMMLIGAAFIFWAANRPTEKERQEQKKWRQIKTDTEAMLAQMKEDAKKPHWWDDL